MILSSMVLSNSENFSARMTPQQPHPRFDFRREFANLAAVVRGEQLYVFAGMVDRRSVRVRTGLSQL